MSLPQFGHCQLHCTSGEDCHSSPRQGDAPLCTVESWSDAVSDIHVDGSSCRTVFEVGWGRTESKPKRRDDLPTWVSCRQDEVRRRILPTYTILPTWINLGMQVWFEFSDRFRGRPCPPPFPMGFVIGGGRIDPPTSAISGQELENQFHNWVWMTGCEESAFGPMGRDLW